MTVDLQPYLVDKETNDLHGPAQYVLRGVVDHLGYGISFAFLNSPIMNSWILVHCVTSTSNPSLDVAFANECSKCDYRFVMVVMKHVELLVDIS